MKLLMSAVKDLLVAANTGDDISEPLLRLEQAMELSEAGWCIAEELRKRYKPESKEEIAA